MSVAKKVSSTPSLPYLTVSEPTQMGISRQVNALVTRLINEWTAIATRVNGSLPEDGSEPMTGTLNGTSIVMSGSIQGASFSTSGSISGGAISGTSLSINGPGSNLVLLTGQGGTSTALIMVGNCTADTSQGAQVQFQNNNAASGVKSMFIRLDANGSMGWLNTAYNATIFSISPTGVLSGSNFGSSQQGLVPSSGGGTTNFLRADGTWAVPPGAGNVSGPGSSTVNDLAVWNNTSGTLLADMTWTTATSKLNLFTSSLQGLVPGSGGGSTNFLRADGAWAVPADNDPQNFVLLNTLTASNSASLQDTTSLTGTYTVYLVVFERIIPVTNAVSFLVQYQVSGTFQSSGYVNIVSTTNAIQLTTTGTLGNASPGLNGQMYVHNPSANDKCMSVATIGYRNSTGAQASNNFPGWWDTTGVVTGLQFLMSSGNISSGTIKIYGLT